MFRKSKIELEASMLKQVVVLWILDLFLYKLEANIAEG